MQTQIYSFFSTYLKLLIIGLSCLLIKNAQSQSILGQSENDTGVRGSSNSFVGVYGSSSASYGVYGQSTSSYGVFGFSSNYHAAYFRGEKGSGFADILLGGIFNGNSTGDDGVIMSDPGLVGSDIFLVANDAVVAKINNNLNGQGNFFVWDGNNTTLFQVDHNGNVSAQGSTFNGSDRNRKEQITGVSYPSVLQAIIKMPIYEWQYLGETRRHIGPIAQDFYKAFGLGDDDKTIATIDADGVALAAIKAQQEIIEDQEKRISQHESEINFLRQQIAELKSLVTSDLLQNK